jgi:D-tyrosyl-tRNA(Tyr) deacylase
MRCVVQRVLEASVKVDGHIVGQIGKGALIFLGIHKDDLLSDVSYLVAKVASLRMFIENEKMNLSLVDIQGEALVVSQFTLYGNCQKGRRPDFLDAAPPSVALPLYEQFVKELKKELPNVATGQFGADMKVSLVNDGPVTLIIDSKR